MLKTVRVVNELSVMILLGTDVQHILSSESLCVANSVQS